MATILNVPTPAYKLLKNLSAYG